MYGVESSRAFIPPCLVSNWPDLIVELWSAVVIPRFFVCNPHSADKKRCRGFPLGDFCNQVGKVTLHAYFAPPAVDVSFPSSTSAGKGGEGGVEQAQANFPRIVVFLGPSGKTPDPGLWGVSGDFGNSTEHVTWGLFWDR